MSWGGSKLPQLISVTSRGHRQLFTHLCISGYEGEETHDEIESRGFLPIADLCWNLLLGSCQLLFWAFGAGEHTGTLCVGFKLSFLPGAGSALSRSAPYRHSNGAQSLRDNREPARRRCLSLRHVCMDIWNSYSLPTQTQTMHNNLPPCPTTPQLMLHANLPILSAAGSQSVGHPFITISHLACLLPHPPNALHPSWSPRKPNTQLVKTLW